METATITTDIEGQLKRREPSESVQAFVREWIAKVRAARSFFKGDFKRMRQDMEFAAGIQWDAQTSIVEEDRYVANFLNRQVNDKVAALYARDPKFIAERQPRLEFEVWDGRMESLEQSVSNAGDPDDVAAKTLILDFTQGRMQKDNLEKIGNTLAILFSWNVHNQKPSFKLQIKQLVRRVVTAGVGFVRLGFTREDQPLWASSDTDSTLQNRIKQAKLIIEELESGKLQNPTPATETLRNLFSSIEDSAQDLEQSDVKERLTFDFPVATSIIPDKACRCLKGFVGARWVAQQTFLPLSAIAAYFERPEILSTSSELVKYSNPSESSTIEETNYIENDPSSIVTQHQADPIGCVFEVWDLDTKTSFFLLDGFNDFLQSPEPAFPETKQFWPWVCLTFNDVETELGCKASIYPPSDVRIAKSAQVEWNKSRNSLANHRVASSPRYVGLKGTASDVDLENLKDLNPHEILWLKGLPPGTKPSDIFGRLPTERIDPLLYQTEPFLQDIFLSLGTEQGPQPASDRATATAATINEQARIVAKSSNVDDLDDLLTQLAEAGGEILIREVSIETVKRVVGPGAVWPELNREDYINQILLKVVGGSSGRPNRALELSNLNLMLPHMIAIGVNPHVIARLMFKILDENFTEDDAFPLGPSPTALLGQGAVPSRSQPIAPTRNGQMQASGPSMKQQESMMQMGSRSVA